MIKDLSSLVDAQAADVSPHTAPSGAAAALVPFTVGVSSQTGRPASLGMDVSDRGRALVGQGIDSHSDVLSSRLQASSPFPFGGTDSFPTVLNDVGQTALADDFNRILNAARAVESHLEYVAKAAPGDLATRLSGRYTGLTVGPPPNASSILGSSGGVRSLSKDRSSDPGNPVIVTLGALLTVPPGFSTAQITAPVLTLSAAQKSALGWTTGVQALGGLSWITGAKMQAPSPAVFSAEDPALWDAAACNGRVEVRIDDSGTVQMFLASGVLSPAADSSLFGRNPSATPYLLPGLWYVWTVLLRSAYNWL